MELFLTIGKLTKKLGIQESLDALTQRVTAEMIVSIVAAPSKNEAGLPRRQRWQQFRK